MKEQIVKRMFWSQLKHLDFAGLRVVINKLVDSGYCLMPTESANLIFNRGYCCNFVRIEYCEEGFDLSKVILKDSIYEWGQFQDYCQNVLEEKENEIAEIRKKLHHLEEEINSIKDFLTSKTYKT